MELPRNCTFAQSDWTALAKYWFPVAFSRDVQSTPVGVRLLDERLALFRLNDGEVAAARDLCIHDREAPLQETLDFNHQVFAEDKAIVESQYPEDLPLDLAAEAHITADKSSLRMQRTQTLLRTRGMKLNVISSMVGYSSPFAFSVASKDPLGSGPVNIAKQAHRAETGCDGGETGWSAIPAQLRPRRQNANQTNGDDETPI